MRIGRIVLLLFLAGFAALAYALWRGHLVVPAEWNPWAPLDVRQAPNWLTGFKLSRLKEDPARCARGLQTSALDYTPMPDSAPGAECPLIDTVRVDASGVRLSAPFRASCPLAVAYALFERHGLQPAARAVYGQPVARVDHFGSFACRNIAGSSRRSQHAGANALDLAGFRLADGTRITVARDWDGNDADARFLRAVKGAACEVFNTTLGPEYNAAHQDHFHVDMGGFGLCR